MKTKQNYVRHIVQTLVLMACLMFIPNLDAYASELESSYVGDDIPSSATTYSEGISSNKSGYMVYVVDSNGNAVSPDAKFVSSTSYTFNRGSEAVWSCNARLGGYSINQSTPIRLDAAWGAPFYFGGGFQTREADIKSWFATTDADGVTNAQKVIQGYWGDAIALSWSSNDYYLVLEPIYEFRMWYKYSIKVVHPTSGTLVEGEYQSKAGAPILVGNVPGLAYNANAFLSSFSTTPVERYFYCGDLGYIVESRTYYRGFTNSGMSSGYARAFPRMEYLNRQIGSVMAGSAGSSYLTCAQLTGSTGWGMLAMSANELAGGVSGSTYTESVAPPSDYDGTVYTLTATGGSSSSGTGSSATTYFGNGSGSCLSGSLYAENCASGTDAYNLADSMKRGMSYDGDVPPVVFSGTSYDLSVDSSLGIIAGMLTVDPSTFPYVDISSTDASGYSSYLSAIKSGIEPSIDRCYDGRVSGTYYEGTMDCSPVIGGSSSNRNYSLEVNCYLTKTNCRASSSSSPTWNVGGEITTLTSQFAKVYYNYGSASSSSGKTLLEGTDLWRAFDTSWRQYVSNLQSSGKLEAYWRSEVEEDKTRVGREAANAAYLTWKSTHPEPVMPTREAGLSDEEWEASEEYTDWLEEHNAWREEVDRIKREASERAIADYNENDFSCYFTTGSSAPTLGISSQKWVFKLYWCNPIMQQSYLVDDKIPIDDGPARGSTLFDDAWKVLFKLYIENNAHLGEDVLQRIIVNLPYADSISTVTGEVTDIPYFLCSKRIPNADFL